jgi:hypothetical protein
MPGNYDQAIEKAAISFLRAAADADQGGQATKDLMAALAARCLPGAIRSSAHRLVDRPGGQKQMIVSTTVHQHVAMRIIHCDKLELESTRAAMNARYPDSRSSMAMATCVSKNHGGAARSL